MSTIKRKQPQRKEESIMGGNLFDTSVLPKTVDHIWNSVIPWLKVGYRSHPRLET